MFQMFINKIFVLREFSILPKMFSYIPIKKISKSFLSQKQKLFIVHIPIKIFILPWNLSILNFVIKFFIHVQIFYHKHLDISLVNFCLFLHCYFTNKSANKESKKTMFSNENIIMHRQHRNQSNKHWLPIRRNWGLSNIQHSRDHWVVNDTFMAINGQGRVLSKANAPIFLETPERKLNTLPKKFTSAKIGI